MICASCQKRTPKDKGYRTADGRARCEACYRQYYRTGKTTRPRGVYHPHLAAGVRIPLSPKQLAVLNELARAANVPVTQLARDAIKLYLEDV
jgi:hypothetical protein